MRWGNDRPARLGHHIYQFIDELVGYPIRRWSTTPRWSSIFAKPCLSQPTSSTGAVDNISRRMHVASAMLDGECVSKEQPAVVLCVDDDPMGLAARRMLLSIAGYDVLVAITGETALQMFRCQKIDLVIADHFLPDSTGAEITAAMKQLKPEVPVVLLTGAMDPPPGSDHVDLILTKGMDPPDFLASIAKLLKPRSANAQ